MRRRNRTAPLGAVGSQGMQALASFVIHVLVARTLGFEGLGAFAILYGVLVLVAAIASGFVGDSLIVLDRRAPRIRAALQQYAASIAIAAAITSAAIVAATGLVDAATAIIFGVALALFSLEELMRRLLMAGNAFWRVMSIDLAAFIAALAVIAITALTGGLTLFAFLLALAIGQIAAIGLGVALLPRRERYLSSPAMGAHGTVFRYGAWRAGQQGLRPALLTTVRTLVTVLASLATTGMLEAARIYVAPAALVVSGISSYLFVTFASDRGVSAREALWRADRAVLVLLAFTVVAGVFLLLSVPLLGTLLFATAPDTLAVAGWVAYAATVAAATPYGVLGAVRGHQAAVFGLRLADTALAASLTAVLLALGGEPRLVPVALAVASLLGGVSIRLLVLVPLTRGTPESGGEHEDRLSHRAAA